jgi:nicotinamidase/pyrazinamidase
MKRNILFVVDYQNDFCNPNGGLYVPGSELLVHKINQEILKDKYTDIWACQDVHPEDHVSFANNHPGKNLFETVKLENGINQVLWPNHCIRGSWGVDFPKELLSERFNLIFRKGTNTDVDSYSAFEDAIGQPTGLEKMIQPEDEFTFIGLATDYCLSSTAVGCAKYGGRKINVILDLIKGVAEESSNIALQKMRDLNIILIGE